MCSLFRRYYWIQFQLNDCLKKDSLFPLLESYDTSGNLYTRIHCFHFHATAANMPLLLVSKLLENMDSHQQHSLNSGRRGTPGLATVPYSQFEILFVWRACNDCLRNLVWILNLNALMGVWREEWLIHHSGKLSVRLLASICNIHTLMFVIRQPLIQLGAQNTLARSLMTIHLC